MLKAKKSTLLKAGIVAALLAALLIVAKYLNGYYMQIIIYIFMFAYFTSAWNIIGGFAGQFSLGHALFIGIGAYTSTILYTHWGITPWLGMLAGGVVAAAIGILIGIPCFKLKSTYFTLTTIALTTIVMLLMQNTRRLGSIKINGAKGIQIPAVSHDDFGAMQFIDKNYYLYIILGMLALVLFVCHWIKTSKMGYQLAAVANNQDAAESLCVNSHLLKLKAMAISCFFCAMGGSFYAQLILICNPTRLFAEALSDKLAIIAMIGGKGLVFGPAFGAMVIESISQFTSATFANVQGLNLAIYGIMLVACIRFFPDGILPIFQKLFRKLASKRKQVR